VREMKTRRITSQSPQNILHHQNEVFVKASRKSFRSYYISLGKNVINFLGNLF
jgi:hypothetical protein